MTHQGAKLPGGAGGLGDPGAEGRAGCAMGRGPSAAHHRGAKVSDAAILKGIWMQNAPDPNGGAGRGFGLVAGERYAPRTPTLLPRRLVA